MSNIFYDGDYTVAQLVGPPEFEIPFKDDPKPYAYRLPYWQFLNSFVDLPRGTPGPLGGIYTGGTPGNFKSVGAGIVEFRREFALVPDTRNEYESFVYQYHLGVFQLGVPGTCIQANPLTVQSRIQFDYFQTDDPESIELPRAPQILDTCAGIFTLGDFPTGATPSGTEVQAEDAIMHVWKPGIYERRMRFIRWISTAELIFGP